jgi:hypothetical protein
LGVDIDYDFYVKHRSIDVDSAHPWAEFDIEGLVGHPVSELSRNSDDLFRISNLIYTSLEARRRLSTGSAGEYSTSEVLRFGPLQFGQQGGKYKVCFCDSAVVGVCDSYDDFRVELGFARVSGLVNTAMPQPSAWGQKCYSQEFGGYACAQVGDEGVLLNRVHFSSFLH